MQGGGTQLRRVPCDSHLVEEGGDVVDVVVYEQPGVLVRVVLGDLGPRESLCFLARHGDHLLISTARLICVTEKLFVQPRTLPPGRTVSQNWWPAVTLARSKMACLHQRLSISNSDRLD